VVSLQATLTDRYHGGVPRLGQVLYHETEYKDNTFTNGGIVYVQNAAPAGPAAWLIAEVSDRLLRWVEDDFKLLKSRGMQTWCCYLDQVCVCVRGAPGAGHSKGGGGGGGAAHPDQASPVFRACMHPRNRCGLLHC
jgi:hypothetical protein